MAIDIFLRTYAKDRTWAKYALQSLRKYATGFRQIIIGVPIGESQYLEGVEGEIVIEVKDHADGYLSQQYHKLTAYNYSDADYIMMWDSDLLCKEEITPDDYMINGKPVIYKTRYEKAGTAICWKEITEKALKTNVGWEFMRRHPNLYHRETLKNFSLYMQLLHNKTLEEYIMEQPYRKFSEFNALNAYCEMFESDKYVFIDTESIEMPPEKLRQFWSHGGISKSMGEINAILFPDFKKELLGLSQDALITDDILSGLNIPYKYTMLGLARLKNIEELLEKTKDVEGSVIETGVWKGGACMLIKHTLNKLKSDKKLYVADSFEGLPHPDEKYPSDEGDTHWDVPMLKVSEEEVRANFERYGLLDENVIFVKGWFEDTLHKIDAKFSLIRLDGDMYSSSIQALEALYPKLVSGGVIIIDDYALKGCREAVDYYRATNGITGNVNIIDWTGIWWTKQ